MNHKFRRLLICILFSLRDHFNFHALLNYVPSRSWLLTPHFKRLNSFDSGITWEWRCLATARLMQESQLCGMKSKLWVPTNQQTDRGCCGSKCSLLEVNRPLLCLSLLLKGSLVDSHQRRESSLVKDFSLIKTQITVPTPLMFPSTVLHCIMTHLKVPNNHFYFCNIIFLLSFI